MKARMIRCPWVTAGLFAASLAAGCGADGGSDYLAVGAGGDAAGPDRSGGFTSSGGGLTGGAAELGGSGGLVPVAGASATGGSTADGGSISTGGDEATGGNATGGSDAQPADCPAAPAGVPAEAAAALRTVNEARVPAGAGCATMVVELNLAAQNHCDYYAANDGSCTADPHSEVEGCTGFTGAGPGDRMRAAGYTGSTASEVMAFSNDPERAVAMWINSVWHRIPVLSPWVTELGYGNAEGCDTIDFGRGTPMPDDTVVLYPYPGQTGLPTDFRGDHEGPEPPMPPTGWPSGVPITVYARDIQVTAHSLTVDGDSAPIDHMWLTSAESNFLRDAVSVYAHQPLANATTYRVSVSGTYAAGALDLQWTFTTE